MTGNPLDPRKIPSNEAEWYRKPPSDWKVTPEILEAWLKQFQRPDGTIVVNFAKLRHFMEQDGGPPTEDEAT